MDDWHRHLPPAWLEGVEPRVLGIAGASHGTPGRHYHTGAHVEDCLGKLQEFPLGSPRAAMWRP